MILQALYRLYETLAAKDMVQEPGWAQSKISYALNLSDDGRILDVFTLIREEPRGKRTARVPSVMKTPLAPKRTVGVDPAFLFDNAGYILGIDLKGKPERTRECFEKSRQLHLELLGDVPSPAARAIVAYFTRWDPDAAQNEPILKDRLDDILTGVNLLFYYDARSVVEDAAIRAAWQARYDGGEGERIRCLVTGEMARAARLHPPIKGVRGAQSTGASLVSFNAAAFESFGREQGMNAPVGERAAFAYTAALNHLLADGDHRQMVGDTTVVMWSESGERAYQDMGMAGLRFDDDAELVGEEAEQAIVGAIEKLAHGDPVYWEGVRIDPSMRYYIMGLAPNAARLSVRFFLENSFGGFMADSQAHQKRIKIVRPAYDKVERLSAEHLLQETVNRNSRDKKPAPRLSGDLLCAMLTDKPYPATLINQVMLRIVAERRVTRGRAAIIKAYYLKNGGLPMSVLGEKLDRDSTYLPYVLGRLFSVLEQVQERANGTATIQDRYFNSASATPAVIFARLIGLDRHHLAKLDDRSRIYYEQQIQELMSRIDNLFPKRMTQAERGAFQLGYYHEQQYRYTNKKDREDKKA